MKTSGDLKDIKGISAQDRKMMEEAEVLLGPEPDEMGVVKNIFWGRIREDLIFPYPEVSQEEKTRADAILAKLKEYLEKEHPRVQIDRDEMIPDWAIKRLFDLKIMGLTIPKEYGGQGLGVTSYNRALEMIGGYCASSGVMVSAHQSIGCKALVLFGTEEQKKKYLPRLAQDTLSAFCLSESNVGCDAGGQETRCEISEDGKFLILNGEKKWSTSGALSGLFTVMAKQTFVNSQTGKSYEGVTAMICDPHLEGIKIFQKNRSKCGIRGTWQARIRFTNTKIPRENVLHKEGKGLQVALTCLNYGRCTLSAGMLGAAKTSMEQAIKWSQTRYQFKRPIGEFELVQKKVAHMSALTYAMDAMLYMTTGFLDRKDSDIMVETAVCKVFNSEMGCRVIDDAMQIMGGEGYMTENELERAFRDSRIFPIVEGANEVMQSFIFSYGGKQLGEQMVGLMNALVWNGKESLGKNLKRIVGNFLSVQLQQRAIPLAGELFLNWKRSQPALPKCHPDLANATQTYAALVRDHSFHFKKISYQLREKLVTSGATHARLSDAAMWLHAIGCVLSRLDRGLRLKSSGTEWERDKSAGLYFVEMAKLEIEDAFHRLYENDDISMRKASQAAMAYMTTLPHKNYFLPEKSPNAAGKGKVPVQEFVNQFPGEA